MIICFIREREGLGDTSPQSLPEVLDCAEPQLLSGHPPHPPSAVLISAAVAPHQPGFALQS